MDRSEPSLVARELERGRLDAFAAGTQPAACLIEGEAGVGKTTLWSYGVRAAERHGFRVLAFRCAEAERPLAFAGLAGLLSDDALDEALPAVPEPRRRALETALLRREPRGRSPSPATVGLGVLSALTALAAKAPLLLAVDDLQWLDVPSSDALAFALRRTAPSVVSLLAAVRLPPGVPSSLTDAFQPDACERVFVGPMSVGALALMLRRRLDPDLPRPFITRVHRECGGNPLVALELTRATLTRGVLPAPNEPLPVPPDVSALIADRLSALTPEERDALLVVAALGRPHPELVARALGGSGGRRALQRLAQRDLVRGGGAEVRCVHPLFASAALAATSPEDLRRLHGRLAQVLEDVEERAWHLALAAPEPSEEVAAALESAGVRARSRGAPQVAAGLLEWAVQMTPPEEAVGRARRAITAAEYCFHAGDLGRAENLAAEALKEAAPQDLQARALALRGEARYHAFSFAEAVPFFERALEAATGETRVRLLTNLAFARMNLGDLAGGDAPAAAALQEAAALDDPGLRAVALAVSAIVGFCLGRPPDWEQVEEALRLEDADLAIVMPTQPSFIGGMLFLLSGGPERACTLLRALRARTLERGEESNLPLLDALLCVAERWRGNLREALTFAAEGLELAREAESETGRAATLAAQAFARATIGEVAEGRADALEAMRIATESSYLSAAISARGALGFLEHSLGEERAAVDALEPLALFAEGRGSCDPVTAAFLPPHVEALVALGELDRAWRLAEALEGLGRRQGAWLAGVGARCRSLVLAARGDLEAASEAVDAAVAEHERTGMPFELARSLLAAGEIHRRRRERALAAEALRRSVDIFEALPAPLWAQRARAEMERLGLRRSRPGELTAAEQRVAELAASGLTNSEIAAQLFLSARTVESHLTAVYGKLGVRSKTELAARLAPGGRSG